MREIIFRGKEKDTPYGPLWRYGDLTHNFNSVLINGRVVDPETVGMYSGHSDVMDVGMYEGDIVTGYFDEDEWPAVVEWDEVSARFVLSGQNSVIPFDEMGGLEVMLIGNIHDNPELLYNGKQSEKSEEVE